MKERNTRDTRKYQQGYHEGYTEGFNNALNFFDDVIKSARKPPTLVIDKEDILVKGDRHGNL